MSKLDYSIKLVYPDWVIDERRGERMGFSAKYKNCTFPIGAKFLVYLTEQQLIMGVNTVTGTWKDGEIFPPSPTYPLRLPVVMDFEVTNDGIGMPIRDIQRVVPEFRPHKDMSFFPLTEDQYNTLETKLMELNR